MTERRHIWKRNEVSLQPMSKETISPRHRGCSGICGVFRTLTSATMWPQSNYPCIVRRYAWILSRMRNDMEDISLKK
jgi:hypothetical protein